MNQVFLFHESGRFSRVILKSSNIYFLQLNRNTNILRFRLNIRYSFTKWIQFSLDVDRTGRGQGDDLGMA